ncbi:Ig-like domain-containing protein [Pseudomonas sp. R37(2017)]|uniref:Ig-like domain-containing protein n=1 Tax=Pseudomonas sp. R37(2017) TaxID=1981685 RepID=UPI0035325329
MLFDGAVAATVADTAAQADSHSTADAAKAPTADHPTASKDTHGQADATPAASPVAVPGQSVVFVDSRVKDADSLLQGVAPGTQVVKLDAGKDGLQQIADYLDQHQGISSVQIIAHGNAGDLWLGDSYLSADNVEARSAVLAEIGKDMNAGGDILIYGCYTAEGERGLSFVDSLAQLTGRDVAASNDRTGLGGDWELEIATGTIESASVLSNQAMQDYQWGLATQTVSSNADSGAGTLRQALSDAVAGDIVTFNAGMTIGLNSQLVITKNLTVDGDLNNDGVADVTLNGQYKTQVLKVNSGVTATLDGLVITHGLAVGQGAAAGTDGVNAMGGGIVNAGDLTLKNVTVTSNAASGGGGGGGVVAPYAGGPVGGGGGGGGALGGQIGGHGGTAGTGTGTYAGTNGSANTGGNGGSYSTTYMGGRGGSSVGGAGAIGASGYSSGGAGGTANNGTISIGGGGGGSGWDRAGRAGASASGGIYNATTGTLTVIGNSVISGNIAAGGGGGGGGGTGGSADPGGAGGKGVGAIWNKGTLLMTAANFAAMTGNIGGSGSGGPAMGGGATGSTPTAVANIYNDGGILNTAYAAGPTATIVVADTALKVGETSLVTITFSEAVTGFTNADLTIANGTLSAVSSSDGGITWTATFTPTASITDTTNVITLDNTGVVNGLGTAGVGTTTSNNYAIDTVRPTATIVVADNALKVGETSLVTFTFSEAVSGFTNADLTIANGTLSAVSSSDGGITWTATFTPTSSITDTTNLITLDNTGVVDLAGNAGTGTTDSNNYAIDTQRPTATIVVTDTNLIAGETSLVTITFSEAVTGFTNADLTIANGTLSAVSSSDGGITWTATFTPTASINDASNLITLNNTGIADLAGNAGSGTTSSNNYVIDTQRPTATIVVADSALKIGETSLVTITFNEAVSGFTNADLTIANGTLSAVSSSDGGITWTATFTPTSNITDTTNLITLDNTGVTDLSGNSGSGTTDSNNYAIDTQRPTATIVVADAALGVGQTSLVTITFSEAVTGFTNADLTIANGTLSAVSSSDGGITWTATFTPAAGITDTTNLITLDNTGVSDLAGNAGSGTTDSNNYVIDSQRPTATIVMADPTLSAGETSLVTITFSEAVTGFTNADLTVPNGTLTAVSSSDGGITWTATFTPNAGVNDTSNLITLNNTGIADLAGNAGTGTTNSANFTIDTVLPTATIVVADSALRVGETSLVTITFSEAVTGFTNADLTIANGTLSAVSSSDGGITWTATFTPTNSITDTTNLITLDNSGVQNASGNAGSGTTDSNNYAIDTQRPTATIVVADAALGVGQTSLVTITFSEAVTGFSLADLTVANGTLSGLATSDNITYTATFTPAAGITDTSNLITLDNTGVSDLAGNSGSGTTDSNNYVIDSQRPTGTIVMSDTDLRPGETSLVTITFSEAVSGFDNSDLSVANGTLSNVSSSDGGITWTATFTPTVGISDATNLIILNNTGITDLAGNAGTGTTSSTNYAVQTQVPTATIVVADTALNVGETSLVTITFSEAVSGFDNADLSVANGTLSNVSSSDGGITWTATFTPTANVTDTSNLISLDNSGVQNASGNAGIGTTDSNNYSIDTQRPTATIVVADTALNLGETSLVTITFSEAVSGFDNADLNVANGTLSAVSSSDGGITWTATFTPAAGITNTSNLITLDNTGVADAAGNAGSGTTDSNNYSIDTQHPTATIVMADPTLSAGETTLVTITFSEPVSGFTNADLSVPNGTLSAVSSSDGGITWTATFTPDAAVKDTTNLITLDNTGIADLAGNIGSGTTSSANFTIDTVLPTATIVVADNALSVGETSLVTITFSEAVSGFDNADLSVVNGTLSNVSSSDGGITWTATFTPTANVTDTSNLISLDNSGVQNASGNAGIGTTDSNNYAIDTMRPTATIVVADTALNVGETSLVTITFSEAVSGFTNADLNVANGTLSAVSSSDGGVTWTATFTPAAGITNTSNLITLDNTGVADAAGNAGSGTTDSNNYSIDTQRPTATIVMADPTLTVGETSLVTITFSEPVSGFTNADLSVPNGTLSAVSSSDGGITWTATFTPDAVVKDTTNLITLDNTGIADLAGNIGTGTTSSANFTIDTVLPTATIVVADSALSVGETSLVTITFSEAVSGFSNADLSIANGTLSAVSSSDGGVTWTATFTPTTNITDSSNLITLDNSGVQNASGNVGSGTTDSNNYAIDTVRPTATIVVADSALNVGETSLVTITFSEAVSGFTNADLNVANGTLSAVSSSDGGITWTATLTPLAAITDTSNLIQLDNSGVQDAAGNAGSGVTNSNNYAIDTQRPTATIVMADTDLRPGETTQVTITFSEAVSGLDSSDLSVANGTLSGLSSSDGGITWTATFTPTSAVTDTSNLITLDNAGVTDAAGNTGSGVTHSANYLVQTSVPSASIVIADTALKAGETTLVTVTFSEAVSGFSNADLSIANGTLSAVSSNDGGITWTAVFTPATNVTDASNLITLDNSGVQNTSGNVGGGITESNNFAIDTALPTATIVVADTQLGIGQTTTVTITFSEAVSGFDVSDISVANGVLSNLSSSDGGVTWTATLTPKANVNDATNLIVLDTGRVQDLAGNSGASIAISNNYALDGTRPTVNIVVANPNLGIGQTTTVTFTFSEAVSNFDLSDLSVTNGDLSNLRSSDGGKTWTATFTPTANVTDPSNFIALDTRNVTDLVGNTGNTVAVSNNYSLDSELPTATIVVANPNLGVGQTSLVTITFSEAVSGFDLSDISIANGTLSDLSSSDGGKTWTATLTPTANINVASNTISIYYAGISDMAGNSGSGVSQSDNFVIDTVPTSSVVIVSPDPDFRTSTPVTLPDVPNVPLQPFVFTPPTGNLSSPLTFQPLFEQRVIGDGIRPLGDIFINNGAMSPSFIAQVFSSSDSGGDGSGHGFLGFGGGDGGVFSTSTLSSLFNQDSGAERDSLNAFGSQSIKSGDVSQGLRGVFGAPTLGQQLQQLKDNEQQQVDNLAAALKLVGISEMQA